MATGVPVCVSPVGMNVQISTMADVGFIAKTEDEWYDALKTLHDDPDLTRRQGKAGRCLVESAFTVDIISKQLGKIIKEAVWSYEV